MTSPIVKTDDAISGQQLFHYLNEPSEMDRGIIGEKTASNGPFYRLQHPIGPMTQNGSTMILIKIDVPFPISFIKMISAETDDKRHSISRRVVLSTHEKHLLSHELTSLAVLYRKRKLKSSPSQTVHQPSLYLEWS